MNKSFKNVMQLHKDTMEYNDKLHLTMIENINIGYQEIMTENLGSQFVKACGQDFAGELVRNYFNTSDYNITVDQLAKRVLYFNYDNDIDPLSDEQNKKNLLNNSEFSKTQKLETERIIEELEISATKLFEKENKEYRDKSIIEKGKADYRKKNGLQDEYGHADITQVDHDIALGGIKYYKDLMKGGSELKKDYNSKENLSNLGKTANQCKGSPSVWQNKETGEIAYNLEKTAKDAENFIDITSTQSTPEQYTEAVVRKLEGGTNRKSETTEKLKKEGMLDKNGKVPIKIKEKILATTKKNYFYESIARLKDTDYKAVSNEAYKNTKKGVGKIIQGQIIYYTLPPIIYEIKYMIERKVGLDDIISELMKSGKRICDYVYSKLKDIFSNILTSSLKKFIKSFFDIIINMVKATIKKLLKMAKQLVVTSVDAIRVLMSDKSPAEKMDAILKLFAGTITMIGLEVLFEYIEKQLGIPEIFLAPIQMVTTIICMNLSMSILEKLDLFNLKFGFKMDKIKKLYEEERNNYVMQVTQYAENNNNQIESIMQELEEEIKEVNLRIKEKDIFKFSVYEEVEMINKIFDMKINFNVEWKKFIGLPELCLEN